MSDHLLVIDEGTTSTRAMLMTFDGRCVASESAELSQHHPAPGRVEHDAAEIWRKTLRVTAAMVAQAGGAERIAAIGITNQRETVVFWDRESGEPLAPAIVWQDRRTAADCRRLAHAGHEPLVQRRSGLLLDPYFSGSKIGWALREWPELAAAGDRLAVGTIDSWLIWKLSRGRHVTDATNASRTALMAIGRDEEGGGDWDDELLGLFGVPRGILPQIVDSAGPIAETRAFGGVIPICGVAGDQQAATIGQACFTPGETKATFGTGAFVLTQAGREPPVSSHRLLSTVAWQLAGERHYALEGSVFVAGTGKAHVVRAALEAMAHQASDLKAAFAADGEDWRTLRIDGGMVANDWMAQDLADMLAVPVERPRFIETTARGAAILAGVGAGVFADLPAAAAAMRGEVECFTPRLGEDERQARLAGWSAAVRQVLDQPSGG